MTISARRLMTMILLGVFTLLNLYVNIASAQEGGRGQHNGPPPEAFTACEGKSAGDTAEFVSPRGDTVTGTCVAEKDSLVLRPDNPPDGKREPKTDD